MLTTKFPCCSLQTFTDTSCMPSALNTTVYCGGQDLKAVLMCVCGVRAWQRAMGEFGAVSVISGNIIGKTQTLTLYVESAYKEYNTEAAFSAAVLLSLLALGTLVLKEGLEQRSAE